MALTEEQTSRFIDAGGVRLHYNEAGSGPTVICLHGGGPGASSWSNYARNFDALAAQFHVYLLDLPCYGKSDSPAVDAPLWTWLGQHVRRFMDALGITQAHLLGNSLGGGAALKLAMDNPSYVDRLVLMGPAGGLPIFAAAPSEGIRNLVSFYTPPGPSLERFTAFLKCMVYDPSVLTDALISSRFAAATKPGMADTFPLQPKVLRQYGEALWTKLSTVTQKTLVVWGRDDRTNTLDQSFIMLNQMPDVQLHVFSQCGHWAQWEKAEEFNRLTIDFLR